MENLLQEFTRNMVDHGYGDNLQDISDILKDCLQNYDVYKREFVFKDSEIPLVDMYIKCKQLEGRSESTINSYRGVIEWMLNYVGKDPQEIDAHDIRMFLIMIKSSGRCQNQSIDKYREYIQHFYRWLVLEGLVERDPTLNIRKIKYDKKEVQPLNRSELDAMRYSCRDIRERAMLETLYSTGCRVSELINIRLRDIDWISQSIIVYGKGKKYRTVFLTDNACELIRKYLSTRYDNSEYLFVGYRSPHNHLSKEAVEGIINHIAKECYLEKRVTPHVIRHTFATLALSEGMDITVISQILGHDDINTTMIYANLDKEAIRKAHRMYVK